MLQALILSLVSSLIFSHLYSETQSADDIGTLTSLESEPSGIIDGHINIITGDFIDYEVDMVIPGPVPLIVDRTLLHNNYKPFKWYTFEKFKSLTEWRDHRHEKILVYKNTHARQRGEYQGRLGDSIIFKWEGNNNGNNFVHINCKMLQRGTTNNSQKIIGAITNIRSYQLELRKDAKPKNIIKSDGTRLVLGEPKKLLKEENFYVCKLEKEYRPDNLRFENETKSKPHCFKRTLKNVLGKELSSFQILNKDDIVACDGRICRRQYTQIGSPSHHVTCLASVDKPNAPKVYYDYWEGKSTPLPDEYVGKNKEGDPTFLQSYLCETPKVKRKFHEDNRFLEVHYYRDEYTLIGGQLRLSAPQFDTYAKVSKLLAPLGVDPTPIPKYEFDYYTPNGPNKGGTVGVYDAHHNLTNYIISTRNRITEIQKYTKDKKPYTIENLYYGPRDTQHEIELNSRTFGLANTPQKTFCKVFRYDLQGNISDEFLYGNLTGKSCINLQVNHDGYPITDCECLIKRHTYSQDQFHLLLNSTDGKTQESYIYLPNTNLPLAKYSKNKTGIYLRHFYDYDENSLVIRHIIDDGTTSDRNNLTGVTTRTIEETLRSTNYPVGLPLVVTHNYLENGQIKRLYSEKNKYDLYGQLTTRETYDSEDTLKYREEWVYNAHGKITHYKNPLGHLILYYYDQNDNKIAEHGPDPRLVKRYTYDYMNRLIAEIEEHPDGTTKKSYKYDWLGNRIESIDTLGNSSKVDYDEFQRPIVKYGTPIPNNQGQLESPTTRITYDEMSYPTSVTDPHGNVTQFKHTLYGKPYYIHYPDGTEEHFEYDIYGRLIKEIAKNNTTTLYTYDEQDRVTHKQVYSMTGELLLETQAGYNTFHLLWEIDPAGIKTTYTYDAAGRKISEAKAGTITHYEYDTLGNIARVTLDDLVKTYQYDFLKRVIEERQEANGNIIDQIRYAYDEAGRTIRTEKQTQSGLSAVEIHYDTHGVPLITKDPNGYEIHSRIVPNYYNELGQKVLCIEVIDPMGQITLTIHNAQGQVVEIQKKSPYDVLIQKTENKRDFNHQILETLHTLYLPDETSKVIVNAFNYDNMQRLIAVIEAKGTPEERQTRSEYNLRGEKEREIKVDGVILNYTYDALGRVSALHSSDNTIHYQYQYDAKSRPTYIKNLIQNTTTIKAYDAHDHLIEETLANGLRLMRQYDTAGRLLTLTLPDQSAIKYTYQGTQHSTIERLNKEGKTLYQHTYNQYDPSSRLLEATMIYDLDKISYQYNLKGELISQKSEMYTENLTYDPIGNLIERCCQDQKETFTYDPLYQLTQETGTFFHTYTHDSLYNRLTKDGKKYTHNALNQLLSDEDNAYAYDMSGNLIHIQGADPATMTYDALDRITTLTLAGESYQFTYDENNRCLTHKCNDNLEAILYLGQNDIGTYDEKGAAKHLRLLGLGKGAETGASVAIEIQGEVFAPFHDYRGNIIALKDKAGDLKESYQYSAFGEEKILDSSGRQITTSAISNPWRYASKRTLHGLVFFGRRLYNPKTGTWLTKDPIGYEGGPNLYAYLNNNALTHHDLYGLADQSLFDRTREYVRDTLNTFRDGLSYAFEKARDSLSTVGTLCREIFHEFVPIPMIRDIGKGLGTLFAEGTLANFIPWHKEDPSQLYTTDECENQLTFLVKDKIYVLTINGIRTVKVHAHDNADHFASIIELKVNFFYVKDNGGVYNVGEVFLNKIYIDTDPVQALVAALREAIHEVGGVEGGGMVIVAAFSQGGQVLANAIEHLNQDERKMIYAGTFGSAAIIDDTKGLGYINNYIAYNDWVSHLANFINNPFGYLKSLIAGASYITWLSPVEWYPVDHRFKSDTYKKGLKEFATDMHEIMRRKDL